MDYASIAIMTVAGDSYRGSPHGNMALEDRFEVLKEIGDGSFGSVVLARVRTAGANVARRGTVVSQIVAECQKLVTDLVCHRSPLNL